MSTENEFGRVLHPKSGEAYAVEITTADKIVRAVGPLDYKLLDPQSEEWIGDDDAGERWIVEHVDQDEALADGAWLDAEFGPKAVKSR